MSLNAPLDYLRGGLERQKDSERELRREIANMESSLDARHKSLKLCLEAQARLSEAIIWADEKWPQKWPDGKDPNQPRKA